MRRKDRSFKCGLRDRLSTFHSLERKCQNSLKVRGPWTENKDEIFLPSTCLKPQHVVYCAAALKMEKPRTASTVMAVWVWPLVDGF